MLRLNEDVVWTDVGDEIRLYDAAQGEFQTLNSSAAEIWRRLAGGGSVADIAAELVAQFGLADEHEERLIERDVREFVDTLLAANLVRELPGEPDPAGGPGAAAGPAPAAGAGPAAAADPSAELGAGAAGRFLVSDD